MLFLILFLIIPSSAHKGKTDSYGGHWDYSAGEYHYHHGYPAHQHIDGTCPYDFDDQTNSASGSFSNDTSGNNEVKKDRKKVRDMVDALRNGGTIPEVDSGYRTPDTSRSNLNSDLTLDVNLFFIIFVILLFAVPYFIYILISFIEKRIYNKSKSKNVQYPLLAFIRKYKIRFVIISSVITLVSIAFFFVLSKCKFNGTFGFLYAQNQNTGEPLSFIASIVLYILFCCFFGMYLLTLISFYIFIMSSILKRTGLYDNQDDDITLPLSCWCAYTPLCVIVFLHVTTIISFPI